MALGAPRLRIFLSIVLSKTNSFTLVTNSLDFSLPFNKYHKYHHMISRDNKVVITSYSIHYTKLYDHPKLMEIKHYHKPPVTYYVTVLGFKIFGVNAFGARFFLQIAILIQLFLIYQITFLLFNDKKISLAAALIYFSLPLVLISSRNLTTDAYLV